jgi:signal transduction histidine kinase/ActR/RegA family two-component response regulator
MDDDAPPVSTFHDFDRISARLATVADPIGFLVNLFAHAPVGFAVWKADGRALLTNEAFLAMFGVEPPPEYNVLEDDLLARTGMLALFQRAFVGETVHVPTFWYDPREVRSVTVHEGRRIAMSMTIFPLFAKDGALEYVAATYKDDTELTLVREREQREAHALRQSQRLEALGTFAGGVAHDFNNLLAIVAAHTAFALDALAEDHPIRRNLEGVHLASRRASALVRQLLAFSQHDQPRRQAVELGAVIDETLELLRATLPSGIELRRDGIAASPTVAADAAQVQQALLNLASNAAHAMAGRGVLVIALEASSISVSDTGAGIDPAIVHRIFEPFFTTRPPGQGSGLGLSVVHGIMQGHGGTVTVDSRPGATTFRLDFPAAQLPAPPIAGPGTGQRVMLVDDEEELLFLTRRLLEKLDYEITTHSDPTAALAEFRARPDAFDAVVTDHAMPAMSGIELVRQVLAIRPALPIVMTSGYLRPGDAELARAAGVHELILKPNTIEELGQVLHAVFARLRATASP